MDKELKGRISAVKRIRDASRKHFVETGRFKRHRPHQIRPGLEEAKPKDNS